MAGVIISILYPQNGTYTNINTLQNNIVVQVNATGITNFTNITTNVLVQVPNGVTYNFTYLNTINTSSSLTYNIPFVWIPNNYTITANVQLTNGTVLTTNSTVNYISIPQLIYSYLIQNYSLQFFLALLGIVLSLAFGFTKMVKKQPFTTKFLLRFLLPTMLWLYTIFLLLNGMTVWDLGIEIVIMGMIAITNVINLVKL